tara:strand:+ start:778 stop:945 length:168 start_codon:yes stop_codon:yes gene_type:complete
MPIEISADPIFLVICCHESPLLVLRYISPGAVPRYMTVGSPGRNMKVQGGAPVLG